MNSHGVNLAWRAARRQLAVAIVAIAVLGVADAAAQPRSETVERAKNYFEAGKQAYAAGQYRVAATAFEEAYKLAPRAPIVFSTAQAYRQEWVVNKRDADLEKALSLYKQYLREVSQGGRRNDAAQLIATLEPAWERVVEQRKAAAAAGEVAPGQAAPAAPAQTTQLMITSKTPGARASIDGGSAGEMPLIADVEPGKHAITVEADGYFPGKAEGVAVSGRLIVVPVNLKPKPAELSFSTPGSATVTIDGRRVEGKTASVAAGTHLVAVTQRGRIPYSEEITVEHGDSQTITASLKMTKQRRASYFVLGGAGALLVGGTVTGLLALGAQGDAEDIESVLADDGENITVADIAEHNDALDRRDRLRTATYVLMGSAVVVGAVGAAMFWMDLDQPETPKRRTIITPTADPESDIFGAAVLGAF